jgi:transposase
MKPSKLREEIRKMRFEELYQQRTEKKLTVEDAAKILGVNERTFRRWSQRYEEQGAEGLADKRLDKAAHNSARADEVSELLDLFETHYRNFNVSHFFDKYRYEHKGTRCYTWVKNHLQEAGLVKKAKKRGVHRRKRPRQPMKGMMLHQDGSTHQWIEGVYWDLIVTMDDADNEIYSAFFVEEEGTWSSFQGMREVILNHGLCCSLYTDRGSHYWYTSEAGGKVNQKELTQFGRALQQLGIDMIPAYSPEARGRSERMFGTLQNRLPQELKLAGIKDMKEANQFLKEKFIPQFNGRFKRKPQEEESAFVPWIHANMNLDDILCIQAQRTVNKDNTVSYKGKLLQIPKNPTRFSFAKTKVKIHEYQDGTIGLFHGPKCLGRFNLEGELIQNKEGKHKTAVNF